MVQGSGVNLGFRQGFGWAWGFVGVEGLEVSWP